MTSEKKVKIISLSLDPDMHELIKVSAKKMGHKNVSQLIRDLISKYLDLHVNENDDIPVILRIPSDVKDDPKSLEKWLNFKAKAICDAILNSN